MARPKLDKSLADYMAIAITPALIMLLTGSLVWFLAELGYDGSRPQRIRWILFWFVIGAVLVARIAIENGRAHASVFLLGLAGATSLTIFKFAPDGPLVPIICLAIVAWCADKLTWDCTLIDESEDASGEGLLQVAGVADEAELPGDTPHPGSEKVEPSSDDSSGSAGDPNSSSQKKPVPFWKRIFVNESERAGQPHAPGLWVVYFSLAALPLFGFGQLWIPATDVASRHFAFQCLLVYVGAALGLLMMTSFLGLRRYLRQRNLQMPTTMAATWVGMGSAIAIGILVVAMLLPRPQGDYSIAQAIDYVSDEVQEASDWAFLDDDGGQGEGQQTGPADEDAEQGSAAESDQNAQSDEDQPGDQVAENGQGKARDAEHGNQPGKGENGNQSQGQDQQPGNQDSQSQQTAQNDTDSENQQSGNSGESSEQQSTDAPTQRQNTDEQLAQNDTGKPVDPSNQESSEDQNPADKQEAGDDREAGDEEVQTEQAESSDPPNRESDSSWMDSIAENAGTLFKWLTYGAVAAGLLYLVIRNWPAVLAFLQNFWNDLLEMFRRKPVVSSVQQDAVEDPVAPPRPFSNFQDPFRSGQAGNRSPGELVRYTFEALQAWAFEHNCGRTPDQTPMEFGQQIQTRRLKISNEAYEVSQLYAQMAYGGLRPDESCMATLQKLWRKLT